MRSLPPILFSSLLFAGCWSFQEVVDSGRDAGDTDSGVSIDMIGHNSIVGDTGPQPDTSPSDMDGPTTDMAGTDMRGSDMGQVPAQCQGVHNVGLWGYGQPAQEVDGDGTDRLGAEVSLVVLQGAVLGATLAYRERVEVGGRWVPQFGTLRAFDDHLSMDVPQSRPDTTEANEAMADAQSVALGLDAAGTSERWAVSGNPCPASGNANPYFWLWNGQFDLPFRYACPAPEIWSLEAVGGYNAYDGTSTVAPGVAYFEYQTAGELTFIEFDQSPHLRTATPEPPARDSAWIHATTGELALVGFSGTDGSGYYDITGIGSGTDGFLGTRNFADPLGVALEHLDGSRYVLATIQGQDVELQDVRPSTGEVMDGPLYDRVISNQPTGLALAAFEGGFVLFFFEDAGGTDLRWRAIPYVADGTGFRRTECEFRYQFPQLAVRDVDLSTRRVGDALQVFAAVSFRQGATQAINVEGPHYPNFFGDP